MNLRCALRAARIIQATNKDTKASIDDGGDKSDKQK